MLTNSSSLHKPSLFPSKAAPILGTSPRWRARGLQGSGALPNKGIDGSIAGDMLVRSGPAGDFPHLK
jgi:hypothetical protein